MSSLDPNKGINYLREVIFKGQNSTLFKSEKQMLRHFKSVDAWLVMVWEDLGEHSGWFHGLSNVFGRAIPRIIAKSVIFWHWNTAV